MSFVDIASTFPVNDEQGHLIVKQGAIAALATDKPINLISQLIRKVYLGVQAAS